MSGERKKISRPLRPSDYMHLPVGYRKWIEYADDLEFRLTASRTKCAAFSGLCDGALAQITALEEENERLKERLES